MILLDGTIVNVALPSRLADHLGRKRVFTAGLLGFAVASAAAGAAPTAQALFAARAVQGAFAALPAASALALVATAFTDPRERRRAIAVFGALGGAGASLGVVPGGALTQWFGWRWCLLVNLPIALTALLGIAVMPAACSNSPSWHRTPATRRTSCPHWSPSVSETVPASSPS
ncbi:MFS transporter [Streptomyces sp. NBC_00893]|uniref:MFS transporter n=1 Tax=Streptomyces sp. NBC_00893 TaxID=2975862 RepID=UPI00225C0158|nr:MFS transporter [Streptomyces sp. NBC_00893]MCX4850839.1 MFS transporter [Streptomyces sp. NBC_00893]